MPASVFVISAKSLPRTTIRGRNPEILSIQQRPWGQGILDTGLRRYDGEYNDAP